MQELQVGLDLFSQVLIQKLNLHQWRIKSPEPWDLLMFTDKKGRKGEGDIIFLLPMNIKNSTVQLQKMYTYYWMTLFTPYDDQILFSHTDDNSTS